MPGVTVSTAVRTGSATSQTADAATYMVAGLTERGPANTPTAVRSLAEYIAAFGQRVTYGTLYDDLRTHFNEGGVKAIVVRAVGAGAALATKNLSATGGSNTLTVNASSVGTWGNAISIQVLAGSSGSLFTLQVTYNGAVVERYVDLASPAAAVAAVAAASSPYIRLVDMGNAGVPPANNPAVAAATALVGGTDDHTTVTATNLLTAVNLIGDAFGTGAVAIPGQPIGNVGAGLITHCQKYNRVALLTTAPATTVSAVTAAAAALIGVTGSGLEYAGLFYPAITIPDGGIVRTITAEGYVAACRAKAILAYGGPWAAAAGEVAAATFVLGVDTPIDRPTGDALNSANINAIRIIAAGGSSPRLYGWRSLSPDTVNYYMLKDRDVLNIVQEEAAQVMEPYVFRTIDGKGQLLAKLQADLVGMLEPIAQAGGLYASFDVNGTLVDPGYLVDVGPSVNTVTTLAANQLNALIACRVAPTAELVNLVITKTPAAEAF